MKSIISVFLLVVSSLSFSQNQNHSIHAGVLVQKSIGMYTDVGLYGEYEPNIALPVAVGFTYVSSRFGSALNSNALKQDCFFVNGTYYFFREKIITMYSGVNVGLMTIDYGSELFDMLPQNAMLASVEFGTRYFYKDIFTVSASFGYNAITGNGVKGIGSVMPIFWQVSGGYVFCHPK